MSRGVMVGCDQKQQWMMPWWWSHFSAHNHLPVAFIDFGMTEHARAWCKARGQLISLVAPRGFVVPKKHIAEDRVETWEKQYGPHVWSGRSLWFYKPFAFLQTPFKKTLWLDLDCEILGPLAPVFNYIHPHSHMAISSTAQEQGEEVEYNSGVVAYDLRSPLLTQWAFTCVHMNDQFLGDQQALTHLIEQSPMEVAELPSKYNWVIQRGVHPEAVVLHWSGSWGKQVIRNRVQLFNPPHNLTNLHPSYSRNNNL